MTYFLQVAYSNASQDTAGSSGPTAAISFCNLLNNGLDSPLSDRLALGSQEPMKDLFLSRVRQTLECGQGSFSPSQCFLQVARDDLSTLAHDRGIPLAVLM